MAETTTITITVPVELKSMLDRLSASMQLSLERLSLEAIEEFARLEIAHLDELEDAIADVEAGRFVTHEQLMTELDQIIEDERRAQVGVSRKAANG